MLGIVFYLNLFYDNNLSDIGGPIFMSLRYLILYFLYIKNIRNPFLLYILTLNQGIAQLAHDLKSPWFQHDSFERQYLLSQLSCIFAVLHFVYNYHYNKLSTMSYIYVCVFKWLLVFSTFFKFIGSNTSFYFYWFNEKAT